MKKGCVENIRPWSDDELVTLRAMKARKMTNQQIADELGRTFYQVTSAVKTRRFHGKVGKKLRTPERMAIVRRWWPTDMDVHEIRAKINALPGDPVTKRNTIAKWADEMGVSRPDGYQPPHQRDGKWTPERDALLREKRPLGWSDTMIWQAVNQLPGEHIEYAKSVWKRAKKLGVPTPRKNGRVAAPKPPKPPKPPKAVKPPPPPKPPRERKPKPPPQPVVIALPPILAGWHEIARWYMLHSGKRDFAPQLMVVNALRRKMGKAPFQPVAGGIRLRGAA